MSKTKHERRIEQLMDDVKDFARRRIIPANAEAILHRLDEITREPGPDEVRVRVCVAVAPGEAWSAFGQDKYSDDEMLEEAWVDPRGPVAYRWIEANVPAWQPPAEPVVKGRVR